MARYRKVVVIGLDGLDPVRVERMLGAGQLPHLDALRRRGGFDRVATTTPAQTPVAWSTFATGANPGAHGIFDFIRRDPLAYRPELGLNRHEQRSALLPPVAVNLRSGVPVWQVLTDAGVPSTVLRCPCTYPPDRLKGRMLSGMGVPDLRGGVGTATLLTTDTTEHALEAEQVVLLTGEGPDYRAALGGPWNAARGEPFTAPLQVSAGTGSGPPSVSVRGSGSPVTARLGQWSEWVQVRFKTGALSRVSGMVRCLLVGGHDPLTLYVSPVNFDPASPAFPISHPWEYARELQQELGPFHTTGFVEDHTGLSNGRFGEAQFLAQCDDALRERTAMMRFELDRFAEGFFFCLFDTPDRLQHMFWRFEEPDHPANRQSPVTGSPFGAVIDEHYRACDAVVGEAMRAVDDQTLCIVLSDHGFGSFQRGVHLNTWLHQEGWLALSAGHEPGEPVDFLRHVDWSRTRAYALGMGSIYLNVRGREGAGIVAPDELRAESARLAGQLAGLEDSERGCRAIRTVRTRDELYHGPRAPESPDLVVGFERGYRVSWDTVLGGVASTLVEDNIRKWGGDHIVDAELVPGALLMNHSFAGNARMVDLAPTILSALGVPVPGTMEGRSLIP